MKLDQANLDIFGQRVVQLCDGRSGLRGGMVVEAKAQEGSPIIEFTASNDRVDRYNEVIAAAGWDLTEYKRNPVFQNSHKYGDIMFTLGKSLLTEVRGNALVQQIEFAVGINPMAKLAYEMYRGKFLNAVSVGFIPLEWEDGKQGQAFSRKFTKQELLELSAVSIPANPDALQNAVKAGAVDKGDLRDLAEFLKKFCSGKAEAESNASASGSAVNDARLLQLARDVRKFLRA